MSWDSGSDDDVLWHSPPSIKLNYDNYEDWSEALWDYLLMCQATYILEDDYTPPQALGPDGIQSKAYLQWQKLDLNVLRLIVLTTDSDVSFRFQGMMTAKERWDEVKRAFEILPDIRWHRLFREISGIKMEHYGDLWEYDHQLYVLKRRLRRLPEQCQLSEQWWIQIFLRGLDDSLSDFVDHCYIRDDFLRDAKVENARLETFTLQSVYEKARRWDELNKLRDREASQSASGEEEGVASTSAKPKKWCRFHKSRAHDNKECLRQRSRQRQKRKRRRNSG